jgi:PIN domain nuclease of toxin-antitoxin system
MRLLLDTHIFLWWAIDPARVPSHATLLIRQAEEIYVSTICIWELAVKARRGKMPVDLMQLIAAAAAAGFRELTVQFPHAAMVALLPPIHFDPFDRLLVAQAVCESLLLITADKQLAGYSPQVQIV